MKKLLLLLPLIWACKQDPTPPAAQPGTNDPTEKTVPAKPGDVASGINFSGYKWIVKSGTGLGPGPNTWKADNVWVDGQGFLHLKVSYDRVSSKWTCAGVTSVQNFGHGTYQWQIQGPVSTLDKNLVAGLFHYAGPDGFNEMDVEFARWADDQKPNVNYSVYPASGSTAKEQHARINWTQVGGTSSTHRYTWTNSSVEFKSMNGFHDDDTNVFFTHTFVPPLTAIPRTSMPIKMNLWCFRGLAPSDNKPVEIVIRSFKFTPAL